MLKIDEHTYMCTAPILCQSKACNFGERGRCMARVIVIDKTLKEFHNRQYISRMKIGGCVMKYEDYKEYLASQLFDNIMKSVEDEKSELLFADRTAKISKLIL